MRSLLSGALYAVGASFVLGVAREVTRQLPIPPLFLTLLAGLLVLGLFLTLLLAWRYESVGQTADGSAGDREVGAGRRGSARR